MSLLINENIEMPTNCRDCPLDEFRCLRNKSDITMRSMERGRHPDCPLVEVPDGHGRLIDERDLIPKGGYVIADGMACVPLRYIANAPTIIPADKEVKT